MHARTLAPSVSLAPTLVARSQPHAGSHETSLSVSFATARCAAPSLTGVFALRAAHLWRATYVLCAANASLAIRSVRFGECIGTLVCAEVFCEPWCSCACNRPIRLFCACVCVRVLFQEGTVFSPSPRICQRMYKPVCVCVCELCAVFFEKGRATRRSVYMCVCACVRVRVSVCVTQDNTARIT